MSMMKYIVVRFLWMIIILFSFISIFYVLIRVVQYQRFNDLGIIDLSRPVIEEYFQWLKGVLTHWDWGKSTSIQRGIPVFDMLLEKLPVTIKVNFIAFLVYVPIGIVLGIISALKKNKTLDDVIGFITIVFMSIPSFVFLFLIDLLFAYQLGWLPAQYPAKDIEGVVRFTSLVLPTVALAVGPIASLTRLLRGELTEIINSNHILLAKTKGLTRRQAIVHHALRPSMVPVLPAIVFYIVGVFSGSLVVGMVYSIPGTGRLFFSALNINNFDYNLILALSTFYIMINLFGALIIDVTYGLVDPRIRIGSKK